MTEPSPLVVDKAPFHQYSKHLAPGYKHVTNLVLDHAKGCFLYSNGVKHLDWTAGYGVASTGYCHPKVVEATTNQINKTYHANIDYLWHKPQLELLKNLMEICPSQLDTFLFMVTGSEAVEHGIKIAKSYTRRNNIIVFQGGFHGKSLGALSLVNSSAQFKMGIAPVMPGVFVAPFPYWHQNLPQNEKECLDQAINGLKLLFKQNCDPRDVACILVEPILGDGGCVVPPNGFYKALREICDEHNILLFFDEIFSGAGRTGKMWAHEHENNCSPDIMTIAKGITSGFPISIVATKNEYCKNIEQGSIGGTWACHPVSCASVNATIEILKEGNLLNNATERGEQLLNGLHRLRDKFPIIDIRGRGLMIGVEFDDTIEKGMKEKISQACFDEQLLVSPSSVFECINIHPPLIISSEEVEMGLERFERALNKVFSSWKK